MNNASQEKLISVILPVHNSEKYIGDAIQSILDQTYSNFELIVLSTTTSNQESLNIVGSFKDGRIRHIKLQNNETLPQSLNLGISESRGDYIARMDADDISLPHRFEKEILFLTNNPDITILGSWVKTFGAKDGYIKHPTKPEEIKASLLFQTSLVHPTVMMRKKVMLENNLTYNPDYYCSEDIDLWARSVEKVKVANIPEILLMYRTHPLQATLVNKEKIAEIRTEIRLRQLAHLGLTPTPRELSIYNMLTEFKVEDSQNFLNDTGAWLIKMAKSNMNTKVYDQKVLEEVLGERWFITCYIDSSKNGFKSWRNFWKSELSSSFKKNGRNVVRLGKFLLRSIL